MARKIFARGVLVTVLLLLCLTAGIIGESDFAADVALIHSLEAIRANSPGLTTLAIVITQAGSSYGTVGGGFAVAAWLACAGNAGSPPC